MEKCENVSIVLLLPCGAIKKFNSCYEVNLNDVLKDLSGKTKRATIFFKSCPNFEKCSKKR